VIITLGIKCAENSFVKINSFRANLAINMKILLVEDDQRIAKPLAEDLKQS
jgi:hypothetical protein